MAAEGPEPIAAPIHPTVEALIRHRLGEALGGLRGSLEAAMPMLAFVIVWSATRERNLAIGAAAVLTVTFAVVRLVQRQTLQYVLGGVFATALAAFFALRSGNAEDAFLPGILTSLAYLIGSLVSVLVRWPVVGLMVGVADQFAYLRNYLGQVLSIFALWRHAKNLLLRMTGRRPVGIDADEFRNFRNHGGTRSAASKPNKRPLFVFFLAVIGLPYLMGKLVKVITARQEAERARIAKEASESGMNLKQLMDAQGGTIDPSKLPFAVARWEYKATNPMELSLNPGDIVAVISKVNPDTKEEGMWWTGRKRDGSMGYFPSPYVEVVDMNSRPSASTQPKARAIEAPPTPATQHEAAANKVRMA